jgi:CheY-like chemotaxis protein
VEAGQRKDEFLAMLGHELRNPLAPIRNAVELIRRGADRSPALEGIADIVDRQVTHLARLVDDLLDASRISRGKMVLARSIVELNRLLEETVESVRPIDSERHNLSVSMPSTPIYINADRVRLTQVLINLLGNAIKFTPNDGLIAVSVAATDDEVEISVEDNGQGIDPSDLGRIFDMFYQGPAAAGRDRGGLGLGLTLVQTLVEMHDGTITADSRGREQGSRFVVRLPRITSTATTNASDAQTLSAVATAQSRRVLVVDDNRDAAETLATLLRMEGAEVEVEFDGEAAVRAAARFQPDLMLLDIGLPKMDGYTAARAIRAKPSGRSIFLVAMTGWGQSEDKKRAMEAGFDLHLVKPVSMDAVIEIFASIRQPA